MAVNISTTQLSSKGQVVIPEAVRTQLGLKPGAQFLVLFHGDTVMLKLIQPPSPQEYRELKARLRRFARDAGLKRTDIPKAIARARGRA